jgi:hypothetical protein
MFESCRAHHLKLLFSIRLGRRISAIAFTRLAFGIRQRAFRLAEMALDPLPAWQIRPGARKLLPCCGARPELNGKYCNVVALLHTFREGLDA